MFHRVDDGLISAPCSVVDDDGTPSGQKSQSHVRVSGVKKVPARADPARGEHAEPAPWLLGPPEQRHCWQPASAPPAQVAISSGMLCIWLGEEKKKVSCSNPSS